MANEKIREVIPAGARKTKLQLADLQVQSFVTALDEHEASQIAGGMINQSRVTECKWDCWTVDHCNG